MSDRDERETTRLIGEAVTSRRKFLAAAGVGGLTLTGLLAACGDEDDDGETTAAAPETTAEAPAETTAAEPADTAAAETTAADTASTSSSVPGVAGGPTGFDGAERYAYDENSAAGRAIAAAKQLKQDGKAPDTLVVGLYAGSVGSYEQPFPEGAPSVAQLWEQETGIKLKFVPVDPAQAIPKATQMAATKDGSQHIVQLDMHSIGDLAEAGLLLDLSEFVDKYQPDWDDPVLGYVGAPTTTQWMNYYNGKPYAVTSDGDFNMYYYRVDLWEDPKEQADFKAKYGYDLIPPETWDQQRDMAEFFHRPDKGLLGATDLRSPAWGWINFVTRFASTANPVNYFWDDEMQPLINTPEGVKALQHMIDTTKFGSPDALTWIWEQQYANWGERGAAMTGAFNNMTKFIKQGSPLDKADAGSVTRALPLAPGWEVDGTLVRHSAIYFNAANGVNVHSPSEHHEVAYCYLQWSASGQIYTWLTGNPGGYQDPCKTMSLDDPLTIEAYTPATVEALKTSIPGTVPTFGLRGANEYIQALDVNLQKALSGQVSAEEALNAVADAWNQTTDKIGRDKQIAAWQAAKAGWPTNPNTAA